MAIRVYVKVIHVIGLLFYHQHVIILITNTEKEINFVEKFSI